MTINYNLFSFEHKGNCYPADDRTIITRVDWVSHGNYAIHQVSKKLDEDPDKWNKGEYFNGYISIERPHFDEIVAALDSSYVDVFTPFWQGDVPPRGMMPAASRLYAYWGEHQETFTLEERVSFWNRLGVSKQTFFTVGEFKELVEKLKTSNVERPVHYVAIDWSKKADA